MHDRGIRIIAQLFLAVYVCVLCVLVYIVLLFIAKESAFHSICRDHLIYMYKYIIASRLLAIIYSRRTTRSLLAVYRFRSLFVAAEFMCVICAIEATRVYTFLLLLRTSHLAERRTHSRFTRPRVHAHTRRRIL